jgi:molybdopterin biosynthesis enzyme
VRVALERRDAVLSVVPLDNQASGALTSLAWAGGLALVPGDVEELAAGSPVDVLRLQDL